MRYTTATATATTAVPASDLFTTRRELDNELIASGTWKALHAAVHASTPRLSSYTHHSSGSEPVCGLRISEDVPHTGQARTRGSIVFTPDGHLTIRAYAIPRHRWLTALQHLGALNLDALRPGAPTATGALASSWSLRPQVKSRSLFGHLPLADHVRATTLTQLPDTVGDTNAMLTVAPERRAACGTAWQLATGFFHVLATDAPARRP